MIVNDLMNLDLRYTVFNGEYDNPYINNTMNLNRGYWRVYNLELELFIETMDIQPNYSTLSSYYHI